MKCINCTGTIGVAHELVDMTTPGFFCIITCCWLKCSKDGRKKWWWRRGGISINVSKTEEEKQNKTKNCNERRIPRRWQIKYHEAYNHRTNYSTFLKILMKFQITFEGWQGVGYNEKIQKVRKCNRLEKVRPFSTLFLGQNIIFALHGQWNRLTTTFKGY